MTSSGCAGFDDALRLGRPGNGRRDVYAAIDLGTNNCRLLIARPNARGFRVIDAFSRIVRLGEGLGRRGALSEDAMQRTVDALQICARKIERKSATQVRAIATEACRRARNRDSFLRLVEEETGIELEIISTEQEAQLALLGCLPLLDSSIDDALVFDIGGGSTEITWMSRRSGRRPENATKDAGLRAWHSVPIGVGTLTERHGGREVTARVFEEMVDQVEAALAPFEVEVGLRPLVEAGGVQMLGTSGTVTTLAGVQKGLPRYNRAAVDGCYLDMQSVIDVCWRIADMSYARRCAHPCIGHDRADMVIAGCAILTAICRLWPVNRLRVADRGLREGLLVTMMGLDRSGGDLPPDQRRYGS